MKIKAKIVLSLLLVSMIGLSATAYQYYRFEQARPAMIEESFIRIADAMVERVDSWFDKNQRISSLLTQMPAIKSMDQQQQIPVLQAAKNTLDWVAVLFVVDTSGNATARSDDRPLQNYSDREYVKQLVAGEAFGQQVLIGQAKPIPLWCFALPIEDPVLVGMVAQCSTLEDVAAMVQKQDIGVSAAVFIVDDQQRLIAHSNTKDFSPKLQDFSDHPALQAALPDASFSQASSLQHTLIDDIPHVFLVRDVGLGWQLVVQQSYSEAYSPYLELRSVALYLIIASVLLVLLLAWALSAHIVTPLSRMNTIADGYTKGRFDESIPYVDRKDEIGELAHAITRMSMSLRLAFQHVNPSKTPSKNDP